MTDTTAAPARTRTKPALTMAFLPDNSGGAIVDTLYGVTPLEAGVVALASPVSARLGFAKVAVACGEIIAKVAPEIKLPFTPSGEIKAMAEIVESDDVALDMEEANTLRLACNGFVETAAYYVQRFAETKGISIPYRSDVAGDFMVKDGALVTFPEIAIEPSQRGLTKSDMDLAVSRWADCIATMAAVANAAPDVSATGATTAPGDDA